MLKLSENPPIIYPEESPLEEIEGPWWVAHTKSRNEKALAFAFAHFNIPYFLPLIEKVTKRKSRVYKTLLPLFSGYVFFSGNSEARHQALATNRIANVIEVVEQGQFVRELVPIYRAITSGLPMDPHPSLKSGDRCRVTAGSLVDCEGIVLRKKNQTKILLQVDILGQAAAVEIAAELLEPIE